MKKKKNSNKNSLKAIYEKVNHDKYSQIVDISGKAEVKSSVKYFLYNYKYIVITILILTLILLIYTFKSNPMVILYCIGFLIVLFLFAMYSACYKLSLDEEKLNVHINLQNSSIDTDSLANIYLSKEKMRLLFIPIYNYQLNIIYIKEDTPMIMSFPTVMVNRKSLVKLFSIIKTEKIKDQKNKK